MEKNKCLWLPSPNLKSTVTKPLRCCVRCTRRGLGCGDSRGRGHEGRRKHPHTWAHTPKHTHGKRADAEKDHLKPRECCVYMRAIRVTKDHTNETEPPRTTSQTRFDKREVTQTGLHLEL